MLPEITEEQRREALAKAWEARMMRCSVKRALKAGTLDPLAALDREDAARMRVRDFLRSLPGVGVTRAAAAMEELGVSKTKRVSGLGCRQRERLEDWIGKNVN